MTNPDTTDTNQGFSLDQRRAFIKLPLKERRRRMAEQANRMVEHYETRMEVTDREQWQGGDIVEY